MKVDSETLHAAPSPNTENVKTEVELPKLVSKKFSEDPLEWNQFRGTYEAEIHQNTRIMLEFSEQLKIPEINLR